MKYCADTWFLLKIYAKDEKAKILFINIKQGAGSLVIPSIVLTETYKNLLQQGINLRQIDEFIDPLEVSFRIELISEDRNIAKEAAKISLSYNIPLVDSIIAATAKLTNCSLILSGDSDLRKLHKARYIKVLSWE